MGAEGELSWKGRELENRGYRGEGSLSGGDVRGGGG